MDNEKIDACLKTISELSCEEWNKVKVVVDMTFSKKKKELEKGLKLSADELDKTIHVQFG